MKIDDKELYYNRYSKVCTLCVHLNKSAASNGQHRCKAFKSIPDVIWDGENDHTEPFPGDNGIVFERVNVS